MEANLADLNFTSAERMDIYRRMFLLNRSFHFVLQRLSELSENSIFNRKDLAELKGLTQEVQTEINTVLLSPLHTAELDDWGTFGKVRAAIEKRLKGPLPKQRRKY